MNSNNFENQTMKPTFKSDMSHIFHQNPKNFAPKDKQLKYSEYFITFFLFKVCGNS